MPKGLVTFRVIDLDGESPREDGLPMMDSGLALGSECPVELLRLRESVRPRSEGDGRATLGGVWLPSADRIFAKEAAVGAVTLLFVTFLVRGARISAKTAALGLKSGWSSGDGVADVATILALVGELVRETFSVGGTEDF